MEKKDICCSTDVVCHFTIIYFSLCLFIQWFLMFWNVLNSFSLLLLIFINILSRFVFHVAVYNFKLDWYYRKCLFIFSPAPLIDSVGVLGSSFKKFTAVKKNLEVFYVIVKSEYGTELMVPIVFTDHLFQCCSYCTLL